MKIDPVDEYLARKLDGGLFATAFIVYIGGKFTMQVRYHTCIDGEVYELKKDGGKCKTKDDLVSLEAECARIGNYEPNREYPFMEQEFTYTELMRIIGGASA